MRRVNRLIRFFHQSWTEKRQANLQLSTKDGDISIKLDLQLGRPEDIMPGPAAAGHPAGAPQRRRPRRHRGPAAKERSRQRAASYHASRASSGAPTGASQASPGANRASHGAASASTQAVDQTQEALNSMLHPVPPPPPLGPTSTRLITVVPRRTGHRSSFSQVDGQDNNSVDDSDCSSTVADGGGPPTASPPPLQPPREDDLRGERRQQVRQPDLLKKTSLDSVSDGEKPDELTGPTTKTDLSGDVKEAAGREATSPDRIPKYCGTCENPLVQSDWREIELRLIIQGHMRPPDRKDCTRCWHENWDKKWQQERDNLCSSSDNDY